MKTRKDPNTIAAIEKAIAEKYGKDTVQDFRNEWQEDKERQYLNQLKEMRIERDKFSTHKEEVVVGDVKITKRSNSQKQDRSCPVCKHIHFPEETTYI